MPAEVSRKARELLESGRIQGFLGLMEDHGHPGPYLFRDPDELARLNLGDRKEAGDGRYPLNGVLIRLARRYPDHTFGVLVRGCDERGLQVLFAWNQLDPEKVVPVGINCPQEMADHCQCLKPYPDQAVAGERAGAVPSQDLAELEALDQAGRFDYWMKAFSKCIKCFGCRDVCPMCFCRECSLAGETLVGTGTLPPDRPLFHLVRAVHLAGRCIDCGLCQEACPADIPLRTLYKKVADILEREFQFRAGDSSGLKSPLLAPGEGPDAGGS